MHTGLVSSELFHSQGSYHSSNAECLMLIQICRKTTRQERGPISLHGTIHNHEFEMKYHNQQVYKIINVQVRVQKIIIRLTVEYLCAVACRLEWM